MLISRLAIKNLLSFKDVDVKLRQLNVLIGANAAGKSNLIDVIELLQQAPGNLTSTIAFGGGVKQWLWLGDSNSRAVASIECELRPSRGMQAGPLVYALKFSDVNGFQIAEESLRRRKASSQNGSAETYFVRAQNRVELGPEFSKQGRLQPQPLSQEPFLAQFKNPADPTPITEVGRSLSEIKIYREFRTGRTSQMRHGISTSVPKEWLDDGGENLALVLQDLDFHGVHDRITPYLRRFCERFEDVKLSIGEGLARIFLKEAGLKEMLSAFRMSGGTLKFLALLAVLFHPKPPPLMCIEEPELGLHPDALQLVAEVLLEASQSMQLIVTTHSEALVDALTDQPETVLVCERDAQTGTQFSRLSKKQLQAWLDRYTLGQLWRKGEIGGSRW
jgi:predicted ATPase